MGRGIGENSLPSHSKPPSRINETRGVGGEGTGNWEKNSHFTKGVNGAEKHYSNDSVGDDEGCRATV
jgi:hypothetical protein